MSQRRNRREKRVWEVRKIGYRGRALLWEEGDGSELDMESLQTLCLCGFRFKLCAEEGAQRTGNAILNSDHIGAPWK